MTNSVIHLIDSRAFGGIETHILHLNDALRAAGIDSSIALWKDYGVHPVFGPAQQRGADVWTCAGSLAHLVSEARRRGALVHAHGYKASLLAKSLSALQLLPAVVTYHSGDVGTGAVRLYTLLDRLARGVVPGAAVSEQVARTYGAEQQLRNFVPLPIGAKAPGWQRAAFVGRMSAEKAPDLMVAAAEQLPETEFLMIGDGPMRESLEHRAPANVRFLGHQRMSDWWDSIDVLCMPSRAEGLPLAALEAMSRGIPVIGSQAGALPQLIDGGRNGWQMEAATAEELARSLRAWRNSPESVLEAISKSARQLIAEQYVAEACLPEVLRLYGRALPAQSLTPATA